MTTLSFQPVSLGTNCEPKYQTARNVFFRLFPGESEEAFSKALVHSRPALFTRLTFDWQVTTFGALVWLLENDFRGGYERDDLEPHAERFGRVYNRRLRACYPHDFPPPFDYTHPLIDANYEMFRARLDLGAERFREHLKAPGPFLYVHKRIAWWDPEPAGRAELLHLLSLLRSRSAEHRCDLLYVEEGDPSDDWTDTQNGLYRRTVRAASKPEDRMWEGDDASWQQMLAEFPLTLHNVIRRKHV